MPTRSEVYKVIDGERDYQQSLPPNRSEDPTRKRGVSEYLTMLDHYVRHAQDSWTLRAGFEQPLHDMRKIAALAVRCMEEWGAPARVVEQGPGGKALNDALCIQTNNLNDKYLRSLVRFDTGMPEQVSGLPKAPEVDVQKELEESRLREEKLRTALAVYADPKNWRFNEFGLDQFQYGDGDETARFALREYTPASKTEQAVAQAKIRGGCYTAADWLKAGDWVRAQPND